MTNPLNNKALRAFGRELIAYGRDLTIKQCDKLVGGQMQVAESPWLRDRIEALGPDAKQLVSELIPEIVDQTLHNLMCMLSDEDHIVVSVTTKNGDTVPNINELSDGLAVDLVFWIEKLTKQRRTRFSVPDKLTPASKPKSPPRRRPSSTRRTTRK